jgi:hypothetical protein
MHDRISMQALCKTTHYPLGVYSTQEKAEAAMGRNAQRSGWADGLRIVEFELDDEPHKMTPAEDAT